MALIYDDKTGMYFDSKNPRVKWDEQEVTSMGYKKPTTPVYTQQQYGMGAPYDPFEIASAYPGTEKLPGYGTAVGLSVPVTQPTMPTAVTPAVTPTPQIPVMPTAKAPTIPTYEPQMDMYNTLLSLLSGMGYNAPGSQEPFLPSSSTSELNQALQNRAMQLLNRPYGYTPEEESLIYQNALRQFNLGREEDIRALEGMAEQYGWNMGAGEMGGQGRSMFQDYMGKRSIAEAGLMGDIAQQIATKRSEDEARALQQAQSINDLIYGQYSQDFSNMLQYMDFNRVSDAQQFDQVMRVAGFMSDEEQRNFMNQLGISDREQEQYWQTRQYEDQATMQWLNYLQSATGLTAEQIFTGMSYADSNEAQILQAAIEKEPGTALVLAMLGLMGMGLFGKEGGISGNIPDIIVGGTEKVIKGVKWVWDNTLGKWFSDDDSSMTNDEMTAYEETGGMSGTPPSITPKVPKPVKIIGNIIAAYGIYETVKGTLKSRGWWPGGKETMTEEDLPFVTYHYLERGMTTDAAQTLNSMNPFEELVFFNELKKGGLKVQKEDKIENLKAINLNSDQIAYLRKYGFHDAPYNFASDENINKIITLLPDENSTGAEWVTFLKRGLLNTYKYDARYFQEQGYSGINDYMPPVSVTDYLSSIDSLLQNGSITQEQYNDAFSYYRQTRDKWE